MNAVTCMMLALGVCAVILAAGCQSEPKAPPPARDAGKGGAAAAPAATGIAQKVCPVMGGPIDPNIFVDYNGRRVYFCCDMCPSQFKKDPDKYLKKLDEQLKAAAEAKAP